MKYTFICNECKEKKIIEQPMRDELPKSLPCEICSNGIMKQDLKAKLKGLNFKTPEEFKALSEYKPRDYGSSDLEEMGLM